VKTTVVTTTINIPAFLKGYEDNARRFGHVVDFVVIGDGKTPHETYEFCKTIPNCVYLGILEQEGYLRRFPKLSNHLPVNSIERRNIGMLWAYEKGADIVVTLDDDNLATSQDAIGCHGIVGSSPLLPTYGSSSGWFNVCQFLKEENNIEFYHRGYSPKHRWEKDAFTSFQYANNKVVINAGFWLDDPDIDAITRLERKVRVTGYKPTFPGTVALAPGTWTPFDCQNTALVREVIPAYFLSPNIGRHSDIFASYVINRLTEHFGNVIAFGDPLVLHNRHSHNLWKDLDIERRGMELTDGFCDALRGIKPHASNYHEGFAEIIDGLQLWAELNDAENILDGMAIWYEVFEELQ
jgi:hypothetical protein